MSERLLPILAEASELGYLGGAVASHLEHALGFAEAVPSSSRRGRAVDLGTGGGVPGLALALLWPEVSWLFVEASAGRARFLTEAVSALGLSARVEVCRARAEEVGRDPAIRHTASLIVARSFAPPAVTAECAAPLLRPGGHLVVSEPPPGPAERWPAGPLAQLGLQLDRIARGAAGFAVLAQTTPCPDRFPRRTGIPAKRPLWTV